MSVSFQLLTNVTKNSTAWNMPKYGPSLVRIFPYMGRTVSVSETVSVFGENHQFCLSTGKYGKRKPIFIIFHAMLKFMWWGSYKCLCDINQKIFSETNIRYAINQHDLPFVHCPNHWHSFRHFKSDVKYLHYPVHFFEHTFNKLSLYVQGLRQVSPWRYYFIFYFLPTLSASIPTIKVFTQRLSRL